MKYCNSANRSLYPQWSTDTEAARRSSQLSRTWEFIESRILPVSDTATRVWIAKNVSQPFPNRVFLFYFLIHREDPSGTDDSAFSFTRFRLPILDTFFLYIFRQQITWVTPKCFWSSRKWTKHNPLFLATTQFRESQHPVYVHWRGWFWDNNYELCFRLKSIRINLAKVNTFRCM